MLHIQGVLVDSTWLAPTDLTNSKFEGICPDGKLPVLQHGTHKLNGSTDSMLNYIEDAFSHPTLVPSDVKKKVDHWVMYIKDTFTPLVGQLLYDGDPSVQQELEPKLEAAFAKLDSAIWEHGKELSQFFFGPQFTLVDVYLVPILLLVEVATYFRGLEINSKHSHLLAYSKGMHSFPSYKPVKVDLELLKLAVGKTLLERAPPPITVMTVLQHRSILWQLDRLVQLADMLAVAKAEIRAGGSKRQGNTQMQSLWKGYGCLLELMQEHAQMEERVVFPALEVAAEGNNDVWCALEPK
jgi:glutathione S-transferase